MLFRPEVRRNGLKSVLLAHRVHPFPFRTRKLSCAVPKILGWKRPGKIGQSRHGEFREELSEPFRKRKLYGGVAQLGEHLPCKQGVMGSNPIISTSGQSPQPRIV